MNEKSRLILDRHGPAELIEAHLGQQCEMIRDIADYGADLICTAYAHSPTQLTDAIKQIVAADALIRIGAIHTANLQARAACEASFYLEWMLLSNSNNKAKHYYVASLRDQKNRRFAPLAEHPKTRASSIILHKPALTIHGHR